MKNVLEHGSRSIHVKDQTVRDDPVVPLERVTMEGTSFGKEHIEEVPDKKWESVCAQKNTEYPHCLVC